MLGYIPDRAYYLTVNRTVELGVVAWSPVNFCPPDNENLPCPAPVGALAPWHGSPEQLALPAPRTDGAATQLGTKLLYIGGSDGSAAQSTVFVAQLSGVGNFDSWTEGPALPEPRSDASVVQVSGTVYVLGGLDADGKPTTTVYTLTPDPKTGVLPAWETAPEYGAVWYPASVASDWAPYRNGYWTDVGAWGPTWVDYAPWGYAPFHYGRWVWRGSYWGWVPGPVAVRPVYAPALVVFVGGPRFSISVSVGNRGPGYVGWFPLGPREVYVPTYRTSPAPSLT